MSQISQIHYRNVVQAIATDDSLKSNGLRDHGEYRDATLADYKTSALLNAFLIDFFQNTDLFQTQEERDGFVAAYIDYMSYLNLTGAPNVVDFGKLIDHLSRQYQQANQTQDTKSKTEFETKLAFILDLIYVESSFLSLRSPRCDNLGGHFAPLEKPYRILHHALHDCHNTGGCSVTLRQELDSVIEQMLALTVEQYQKAAQCVDQKTVSPLVPLFAGILLEKAKAWQDTGKNTRETRFLKGLGELLWLSLVTVFTLGIIWHQNTIKKPNTPRFFKPALIEIDMEAFEKESSAVITQTKHPL